MEADGVEELTPGSRVWLEGESAVAGGAVAAGVGVVAAAEAVEEEAEEEAMGIAANSRAKRAGGGNGDWGEKP